MGVLLVKYIVVVAIGEHFPHSVLPQLVVNQPQVLRGRALAHPGSCAAARSADQLLNNGAATAYPLLRDDKAPGLAGLAYFQSVYP
jgi:hypothetical protein